MTVNPSKLSVLARKVRITSTYGNVSTPWEKMDDWQQKSHPYRVTLRYKGRQMSLDFFMGQAHEKEPDAAGVLACLISDASALDQSFEEWCGDFGYETDSRKALATYDLCCTQGEKLRRLLGSDFDSFCYSENDV